MLSTPASALPAALQRFVDDELMRAPMLAEQVIEAALDQVRKELPRQAPAERSQSADLLEKVQQYRQSLVDAYLASLRWQTRRAAAGADAAAPAASKKLSLSLVDEESVAVDVEISHCVEAIRSVAEYELRELQTFTAALVGDMDFSRDHNPFHPETHARALWACCQSLPLSRGHQLGFMRPAAAALAQVLRKTYAGASSRLESQGIEPAAYRTLILPSGSRSPRRQQPLMDASLGQIRNSLPPMAVASGRTKAGAGAQGARSAPQGGDAQAPHVGADLPSPPPSPPTPTPDESLLQRLFDALLADRGLAADARALIERLQAPLQTLAQQEPQALDLEAHPAWRFIARLVFLSEMLSEPGAEVPDTAAATAMLPTNRHRRLTLRFAQGLIDHIAGEAEQNAPLYQWALDRLLRHEQHVLEQRCKAAAEEIGALQALENRLLQPGAQPPTTWHGAIDLGHMDTVPAELITQGPGPRMPARSAHAWLQQRRPGEWLRVFMQGSWTHAQLLWPGEHGELWLVAEAGGPATWAMRRGALMTLHREGLLRVLEPRPVLREAAQRVMHQMVRAS